MIHNEFLYCDRCGKPIKLASGMDFFFDKKKDYCSRCAAGMIAKPKPHYTLLQRIVRWFQGW